ncbi:hypothetical protein [Dokdonia sp.]|uniref:hypothetical protein n=1 Tax=Dokdonia sp. TaxID=2024995 RepID=UPI003262D6F5
MKINLLLCLFFISFTSLGQSDFLLGKWKFEKIPENIDIDDLGLEMAKDLFKDMSFSFDATNYSQFIMGKSESGTWRLIDGDKYELTASKGYRLEVGIKKISDTQIIYTQDNIELQLLKTNEKVIIEKQTNTLDKIEGIIINPETLESTWIYNGQIKDGKENPLILKHDTDEIVNYTFKKDRTFINRAPFGIELIGTWKIENDGKTIQVDSQEKSEFLKVVMLNTSELHLYNPLNESIIKFKKKK